MSDYANFMSRAFVAGTFPPGSIAAPVVTGVGTVGQVLTAATNGTWTNAPSSYTYQWVRQPNTNIGTNASTYTLVAGDSGFWVRCFVSATNAAGVSSVSPPSNMIRVA